MREALGQEVEQIAVLVTNIGVAASRLDESDNPQNIYDNAVKVLEEVKTKLEKVRRIL